MNAAQVAARRAFAQALRAQADAHDAETDALETEDELLTVEAAAEIAHVTVRVFQNDEKKGRLVLLGAGRKRLVRRSELERWLSTRRRPSITNTNDHDPADLDRVAARIARSA
jgi:hypothetical protein